MTETLSQANAQAETTYRQPVLSLHLAEEINEVLRRVASTITPVWPLKDYVAVNPYAGIAERRFLDARAFLQVFSDCETLLPVEHYANQYQQGRFGVADIEAAVEELKAAGFTPQSSVSIREALESLDTDEPLPSRSRLRTVTEHAEFKTEISWSETVLNSISAFCANHYDEGQAAWASPGSKLPLFQAWRQSAVHDRSVEILGLKGFRAFVSQLPHSPEAAIVTCLEMLEVPAAMWETVLLCNAFSMPGWSAWTRYQSDEASHRGTLRNDFIGLLAIRLAYEVAVSQTFAVSVDWDSYAERSSQASMSQSFSESALLRYTLLRASEIGYRESLLSSLNLAQASGDEPAAQRKLAQLVFCIDVRSERMRRQLETLSPALETYGFAGFFGMPLEFLPLDANPTSNSCGDNHVPVLLKPQFQVREGLKDEDGQESLAVAKRGKLRLWRKMWKGLQGSAIGCFSFVEAMGLTYGFKLLARAFDWKIGSISSRFDGVAGESHAKLGPTLRGLHQQGITTSRQADLAESMLKNLGLTGGFARLVVFCGHASQTNNNPLAAGLDCGACGGHSGEPNARFAAMLLNQPAIRQTLRERGIDIPSDTHFLAALHNTTTDSIEYFDTDELSSTHLGDLQELRGYSTTASELTAQQRMPSVACHSLAELMRRASDWSEVRPEWGLAGNAAFIAAPRTMTQNLDLNGRAFLHSYDWQQDADGSVLETIMTAPMIVANWINLQYYASTVDQTHFGSGDKTLHNVVGRFGILSGTTGDLMTGLPWQSLHDGNALQHLPLRLQAVIAAPRNSIERVIEKHEVVSNLLTNGWMHLIAIDDGVAYRYAEDGSWQALSETAVEVVI